MRTAEIYFCKEPKLTYTQNKQDHKEITMKKRADENNKQSNLLDDSNEKEHYSSTNTE